MEASTALDSAMGTDINSVRSAVSATLLTGLRSNRISAPYVPELGSRLVGLTQSKLGVLLGYICARISLYASYVLNIVHYAIT